MEIQKVFSDVSNEERLYNILMSEDEMALYSEFKKNNLRLPCKIGKYLEIKGDIPNLENKISSSWKSIVDTIWKLELPYSKITRNDWENGLELFYIEYSPSFGECIDLTFGPTGNLRKYYNNGFSWTAIIDSKTGKFIEAYCNGD